MISNVLTEKEAKEKWCPWSESTPANRCIASGCMMWRWYLIDGGDAPPTGNCGLSSMLGFEFTT